jgi:hypothetical protein
MSQDEKMSWESDARGVYENFLKDAKWDAKEKTVTLAGMGEDARGEPIDTVCKSVEDLREILVNAVWRDNDGSMPYDGGEPVFENDAGDTVDEVLTLPEVTKNLKLLGWEA